ncbi:Protein of unknown function (DUF3037) [Branchiibius hedensis]|uniref:DUF3037 domain-containing protein n=1 Tax=Branchiibius hedensis TaxID=672460 RepID=A0A2Y8ZQ86_9MICO|nr:DUF3037 domain-containing protein [Branchiibius hedensis]PWJ25189.1 Protein of unknown function (DUF3037) [Branchiibius hedensis]SSA34004.1 Protein of unknown function [Branchiibius hedensis]
MRYGYQYVVLRYVPAVEREEFVNVGVVLYAQLADFLGVAYSLDAPRLQAFSPAVDLPALTQSLAALERVCEDDPPPGLPQHAKPGQRFGWLSAPRSTVLQPGPVHGGVTADPAAELQRLLAKLVT